MGVWAGFGRMARVKEGVEMDDAGSGIFAVTDQATTALCVVFSVYLLVKGPTRVLKIGLVFFVLGFAAVQAVKVGWAVAIGLLLTLLVMNVVVAMATTIMLRHPCGRTCWLQGRRRARDTP